MIRSLSPIQYSFRFQNPTSRFSKISSTPFSTKPLLPLFKEKVSSQPDNPLATSLKGRVAKPEIDFFYEKIFITPEAKTLLVRGEPEEAAIGDLIQSGDIERVFFDTYEYGSIATPELFHIILKAAFAANKTRVDVKLISFKKRDDALPPKYSADLSLIQEVFSRDKVPKGWRPSLKLYPQTAGLFVLECGENSTPQRIQNLAVFLAQQVRENQIRVEIELRQEPISSNNPSTPCLISL